MRRSPFAAFALLALGSVAPAQLRVANWNLTNYSSGRVADFSTALYGSFNGRSFAPDVLLAQEILGANPASNFLAILNGAAGSPGDWALAPFVNNTNGAEGSNSGSNALYYRTSRVDLLGQASVEKTPRDGMRYDVRFKGYQNQANAPTLSLYSDHFKSGSTSADIATRNAEATAVRADAATLPAGRNFLLGADLNVQNSTEADYQALVGAGSNPTGRFYDPINSPGTWNNNSAYRFLHTQDPVGSGGMDDRLDQILISGGLRDGKGLDYIGSATQAYSTTTWNDPNHSYRVWGNDGTSFNQQLTTAGNAMVGPAIAQALRNSVGTNDNPNVVGGHLPVFLDLKMAAEIASATTLLDFGDVGVGTDAERAFDVFNGVDAALYGAAGIQNLQVAFGTTAGFSAPGGTFTIGAGAGATSFLADVDTSSQGLRTGTLTITDIGGTTRTIALRANVVPEPATLVALGVGAVAMLRRRRAV